METSALITMLLGMVIIWGSMAASIWYMLRTERGKKRDS